MAELRSEGRLQRLLEESVIGRFMKCGDPHHGFARIYCPNCRHDFLLAFSCKARYFCPSCHQKRVLAYGDWVEENVLAPVPHRQYVFTVPRLLRPIFSRRRGLLGELCHIVERLLSEAYSGAAVEGRQGLILFVQTFGDLVTFNPHIHVLAADGVFRADGVFVALPAVPLKLLAQGFRSKVLKLLVAERAIGKQLSDRMLAWPHARLAPQRLLRPQWRARSRQRRRGTQEARSIHAARAVLAGEDDLTPGDGNGHVPLSHAQETEAQFPIDARRAMARAALPAYSGPLRAPCAVCRLVFDPLPRRAGTRRCVGGGGASTEDGEVIAARARSAWARLIHKVYEVDPLVCPKCGVPMHVIALIDDATVIRRILEHLGRWAPRQARKNQRAPPADGKGFDGPKPPVCEWSYHPVPDIA